MSYEISNIETLKRWNESINEQSAVLGMRLLKALCEAYQQELNAENEAYDTRKKENRNRNEQNLQAIDDRHAAAVAAAKTAYAAIKALIQKRERESYVAIQEDLEAFLKNNVSEGAIRKLLEKLAASSVETMEQNTEASIQKTNQLRNALAAALKKQLEQEEELYKAKVAKINADKDLARDEEIARYQEETDALQRDFDAKKEDMKKRYADLLTGMMSGTAVGDYIKMVQSSIPSFSQFSCAGQIPEYVCLGDATLTIAKRAELCPEVVDLLLHDASKAIDSNASFTFTARLPYCQRLDDGISLFLKYMPNDRKACQEQLKMLLLKLFMAFPAGKLEATMIDPVELGGTFSMFTPLGAEESRIINTKSWSKPEDITEAISILRQKIETIMAAYGADREARLQHEPVRVLAITDFPTGFSREALQDLQAIVRKSRSCGICVFIWANSDEIDMLQEANQSVFKEIQQTLHCASATFSGALLELSDTTEKVHLCLDDMTPAADDTKSIIDTLTSGIRQCPTPIVPFYSMYKGLEDPNNWFGETTLKEFSIPLGIKGASTVVRMNVGKAHSSTKHHVLIAGQTGSGKSTLLHTLIMGTLLNYSPDEAQLYLVDFKQGVAFKTYSKQNLPSIRIVAVDCEREFGLSVLQEVKREMERRYVLFRRETDQEEIFEYREKTGAKLPRILVIFDEVQELFRVSDNISQECETILGELLTLGRAAGIHIILASQSFNLLPSLKAMLFAHAAIRIAIKGSEDSASSVLGDNNNGAKELQERREAGLAVFNHDSGKEAENVVFQIGIMDKAEQKTALSKLSALYGSDAFAKKYPEKTRVLLTNAEDDIFNVFNQFMLHRKVDTLDDDPARYHLTIGDSFSIRSKFQISIAPQAGQNLLMIGTDEKCAKSMFCFTILSLLYGELGNHDVRKDNQLVQLIDLSNVNAVEEEGETGFAHLEALFKDQIVSAKLRDMDQMIGATYDTLMRRMNGEEDTKERLFLMVFGISRAAKLVNTNVYLDTTVAANDDEAVGSTHAKLLAIIQHGAAYGINCIVWGENLEATARALKKTIGSSFAQRIVFSSDDETLKSLVSEYNGNELCPTTAVFMNVNEDTTNTHFRPYDMPVKDWVEHFAEIYREFEHAEVTGNE